MKVSLEVKLHETCNVYSTHSFMWMTLIVSLKQVTLQSLHPSVPIEKIRTYANVFILPLTVRTLISVNINCQSTFGIETRLWIEIENKAQNEERRFLFSTQA